MHLDKTPLEYLLYRYQTGEDIEELSKANRQLTAEDEKKMKEGSVFVIEGQKRILDDIHARKKLKQSYEYEVSFKAMSSSESELWLLSGVCIPDFDSDLWFPRDELIKRGFEKKIIALDTKEAQRLGLLRPLVRKEIESHFNDFGLESEFVTHNTVRFCFLSDFALSDFLL
jgi:elongation factor 3